MRMTLCADCLKKGARGVNNGICSNSDGGNVNSTEHTDDQEEMVTYGYKSSQYAPCRSHTVIAALGRWAGLLAA